MTSTTTSPAHARLVGALEAAGSRVSNGGKAAQCPAHEDRDPSLSIGPRADGEGVLVHCHAGCDVGAVLEAVKLSPRDLFDEPRARQDRPSAPPPRPRVVCAYVYTDEAGAPLFRKLRRSDKSFPQERPDGRGGWRSGLGAPGEVRRVLYRLPAVVAAIAAGAPVVVCEGEKDSDNVTAAGWTATTWPEGAWTPGQSPKWRREYTQTLRGARVLIVRDRDAPGRAAAAHIAAELEGVAASVVVVEPVEGKDVSDHLEAGHGMDELRPVDLAAELVEDHPDDDEGDPDDDDPDEGRRVILTSAATIKPRPVFWLWEGRIALGTLALLAGREGLGKSTCGYWLAARITRGELPGEYAGQPRAVIVAATEDSWEHTIVPRLMAAGADLARVFRVDVVTDIGIHVGLSLPRDLVALERNARDVGAALLLLDPLMSRLGSLDTHRDAEVRQALEPLVAIADKARMSVLGLIHHNKSGSADPLQLVMGSKAFTAVARSVHTVVPDPDDESDTRRLFGTPKNNLGRTDLPTLAFTIVGHPVDTDEGTAWTGRLEWGDDSDVTIRDAMRRAADDESGDDSSEAAGWLSDYLESKGGRAPSSDVKKAAAVVGIRERALRNARKRLRLLTPAEGFPRVTWWELPTLVAASRDSGDTPPRGDVTTDMTDTTGRSRDSRDSGDSRDGPGKPRHDCDPTEGRDLEGPPCATCGEPVGELRTAYGRTTCAGCERAS